MNVSATQQRFILHWGEMGTKWGINRTVAQIHALLFVSPEPIDAEEIAATLQISRSNVSMSIKELQSWGIIRPVQKMGDRRTYFETIGDVWEMFRRVLIERKKREVDPTVTLLRDCLLGEEGATDTDILVRQRIESMLAFFEQTSAAFDLLKDIPPDQAMNLLQLGTSLLSGMKGEEP